MTTPIRSRKVRRILRLEGQADRQAHREARATGRAAVLRRRVDALRTEARALEASLTGAERAELARARAGAAPGLRVPPGPRAARRPRLAEPRSWPDRAHAEAAADPAAGFAPGRCPVTGAAG